MPAPFPRPAVRIRVVDPQAQPIVVATVTATPSGSTQSVNVPWEEYWRAYMNPQLFPGGWRLDVAAPGFFGQVRNVEFVADSIETFVLSSRRVKVYYRGFVPIPCDIRLIVGVGMQYGNDDAIAAIRQIPTELGLPPFTEVPVAESVHRQRVYAFEIPNGDAAIGRQFEQRARLNQAVRAVGEVVHITEDSVSFATDQIIVKLRAGVPVPDFSQFGLERVRPLEPFDDTFLVRAKSSGDALDSLERLNNIHAVMWAEPNLFSTIVAHATDMFINAQPHHVLLKSFDAWSVTQGRGTRIAVIDTGCLLSHEDLKNNIQDSFNFDAMTNAVTVGDGHGTGTAGIAAAEYDNGIGVAGVAGRAALVPVQINADYDVTYGDAFLWSGGIPITSMPPGFATALAPPAAVLSVSCGIRGLPAGALSTTPGMGGLFAMVFDMLEQNARDGKGCVRVFSSGNDNDDLALRWPWAAYPTNVAVGSSSVDLPPAAAAAPLTLEHRVFDSNYGVELDLCAPGGSKAPEHATTSTVAFVDPFTGYMYSDFIQTSCACPQVAGVAALILAVNPALGAGAVRQMLAECADKIGTQAGLEEYDTSTLSFSRAYGYGRVNAACAVGRAQRLRRWRIDLSRVLSNWWRGMFSRDSASA